MVLFAAVSQGVCLKRVRERIRKAELGRKQVRVRIGETHPLTMTVIYGTPSVKYDHLGVSEFHYCSILQEEYDWACM